MNDGRNRERGHCYHLKTDRWRYVRAEGVYKLGSEACMKYEDSRSCRGALFDSRKGENAKRNKKQNGQQSRRNGHVRNFRAEIGTRCSS